MSVTASALLQLEAQAKSSGRMIQAIRHAINEAKRESSAAVGSKKLPPKEHLAALKKENAEMMTQVEHYRQLLLKMGNLAPALIECSAGTRDTAVGGKAPAKTTPSGDKPVAAPAAAEPAKDKKPKSNKLAAAPAAAGPVDIGLLDMRVGVILSAEKHPDADSLYVEQVDVGEDKPRTVISGLVNHIPMQEMQNRRAIIMCNLKPVKMRGIFSHAMVMCASTPEKVEILNPPASAKPGEPVLVDGFERRPVPVLNPKKKIFETCAPDLKVDADGAATYRGVKWTVGGQEVRAPSMTGVQIK